MTAIITWVGPGAPIPPLADGICCPLGRLVTAPSASTLLSGVLLAAASPCTGTNREGLSSQELVDVHL